MLIRLQRSKNINWIPTFYFYKLYYYIFTYYSYIFTCCCTIGSALYFLYTCIYYACFVEETLALAAAVRAGAEKVAGITRERYIKRLTWLREFTRLSIAFNHDDKKKPAYIRISNVLENLRLDSADGKLRMQPYCILLSGPPGVGKTGTAMKIAAMLMKAKHGRFRSTDVVTLNETDEFQSEYRTNHRVVIFDDIGADKIRPSGVNPWRKVIDFVNNIKKTALNPNLEMKGNVYIEPELVIMTTNLCNGLQVPFWMNCPEAIFRRINLFLELNSFTHACRVPMVKHPRPLRGDGVLTNGQRYEEFKQTPEYQDLDTLLDPVVPEFLSHCDQQADYVEKMNSLLDSDDEVCSPLTCFWQDQILPLLPRKIALPLEVEALLPWYHRFARKLCVADSGAICQVSICDDDSLEASVRTSTSEIEDNRAFFDNSANQWHCDCDLQTQGGEIDEEICLETPPNTPRVTTLFPPISELTHHQKVLDILFDIENYLIFEHLIVDGYYAPCDFGYLVKCHGALVNPKRHHLFSQTSEHYYYYSADEIREAYFRYCKRLSDAYPTAFHDRDMYDMLISSKCAEEFKAFRPTKKEKKLLKEAREKDDCSKITSPVYYGEVIKFISHSYKGIDFDERQLMSKAMLEMLRNCQRKLAEMGAQNQLPNHSSSLLAYQMIRRAWHAKQKEFEVEDKINGLTIDARFRCGETLTLVEAKTRLEPDEQIKRYMRDVALDQPVIGIGISYTRYVIYYAGKVPEKDLVTAAKICSAVFRFFQLYGKHFRVSFPFTKYKIHDDTYPPPKSWTA
ncbi:hypothetical protein 2 [Beihai picorna-like virus 41]|uniref:hypothetical protein 2 n=1 Tax=Beihai picorna-like virus 41 TaxID=1922585 RepID=UPI00090C8A05|nr:hypothetical protein 2 [Beihai picorna-like virus 41]APG76808.1 hypothetical protein 2 [Beihai picorna-like virus 41]